MGVLSDIRSHMIGLIDGSIAPTSRAIDEGRFVHVNDCVNPPSEAASAPYPFELEDQGAFEPLGVPSTLDGSHVYRGRRIVVRVMYDEDLTDKEARRQVITDDESALRACLEYPRSFDAVASDTGGEGYVNGVVSDSRWAPVERPTPGATRPPNYVLILELVLDVTYREEV